MTEKTNLNEALKRYFGFDTFKGDQEAIIRNVLEGNDTFVLMKDCPDEFHPRQKVGEGVYCTPNIKAVEKYAGKSEINGIIYKTVLMVRVKPDALRHCNKCLDSRTNNYWVVNGTNDEIRPYRILYKKCKEI